MSTDEPLTADNWQERARAVETGEAPSGSLVVALTGPASVTSPGARPCVSECGLAAEPGDVYCSGCRSSIR